MHGWLKPTSHAETITRRRRRISSKLSYNQTIARGRPDRDCFVQCAGDQCHKCGYEDYSLVARPGIVLDSDYTWDRNELLYDTLITHFWGPRPKDKEENAVDMTDEEKAIREKPWHEQSWQEKGDTLHDEEWGDRQKAFKEKRAWHNKDNKWHRIESYVRSPPVMGAFAQFMRCVEDNDQGIRCETEYDVADALAEHRDDLIINIKALRRWRIDELHGAGHWRFFRHHYSWAVYPKTWTIKEYLIQFSLLCESWRNMAVEAHGAKMWEYPGADDVEKIVDFLGALLVHFVYMRKEGAMSFYSREGDENNKDWERWDDKYQVFAEFLEEHEERQEIRFEGWRLAKDAGERGVSLSDEELLVIAKEEVRVRDGQARDGEECFEALGKGPDRNAWMTRRMKASIGARPVWDPRTFI